LLNDLDYQTKIVGETSQKKTGITHLGLPVFKITYYIY